jgi:hypothetical protein
VRRLLKVSVSFLGKRAKGEWKERRERTRTRDTNEKNEMLLTGVVFGPRRHAYTNPLNTGCQMIGQQQKERKGITLIFEGGPCESLFVLHK